MHYLTLSIHGIYQSSTLDNDNYPCNVLQHPCHATLAQMNNKQSGSLDRLEVRTMD
jgi:hypothetical protein